MKQRWFRNLLGGLSLTSALFVFQACYGTPQDVAFDVLIEGQVKAFTTGSPVKGIKVSIPSVMQYQFTDADGKFSFYTETADSYSLKFEDVDAALNDSFATKDTLISGIARGVYLNIVLQEN